MATTQEQLAMLRQGANNNRTDVSAIQNALKSYGFYNGTVDGLFGPKTAQAVRDFQNTTGIKVDAIVGPQTRGKLDEWSKDPTHALKNDPIVQNLMQNDPIVAKTINNAQGNQLDTIAMGHNLANKGLYFGGGVFVDTNTMQPFYDAAKKLGDPEFNERLNYYKADLQAGIDKEKADYESALKDTQDKIFNEKLSLDTNQAQTNNIDSSLGATQRQMFTDQGNRMLSGLERNTSYKLSDLARNFENKYGTQDVGQFNFNISQPGSVNSIGKYQAGSGTKNAYTPIGGMQGGLRPKYASQLQDYGNQMAQSAYNYPYIRKGNY